MGGVNCIVLPPLLLSLTPLLAYPLDTLGWKVHPSVSLSLRTACCSATRASMRACHFCMRSYMDCELSLATRPPSAPPPSPPRPPRLSLGWKVQSCSSERLAASAFASCRDRRKRCSLQVGGGGQTHVCVREPQHTSRATPHSPVQSLHRRGLGGLPLQSSSFCHPRLGSLLLRANSCGVGCTCSCTSTLRTASRHRSPTTGRRCRSLGGAPGLIARLCRLTGSSRCSSSSSALV